MEKEAPYSATSSMLSTKTCLLNLLVLFQPCYSASFNWCFKQLFARLLLEEHVSEGVYYRWFHSYS